MPFTELFDQSCCTWNELSPGKGLTIVVPLPSQLSTIGERSCARAFRRGSRRADDVEDRRGSGRGARAWIERSAHRGTSLGRSDPLSDASRSDVMARFRQAESSDGSGGW